MTNTEICIIFLCSTAFVSGMIMLINTIINRKRQKYIESIKTGDIFVYHSDVSLYYRRIEEYKHELTNPFNPKGIRLFFPDSTCIIKELKESETGEIWVCYNLVDTPHKITIAENTSNLIEQYKTLDEFLEFRERVERFEIE